ncbi:MAG: hypothetical protein HDT09_00210 [Bacteroidales bacterium]|nr:hypothetical protein [Bacteroidales bacterium]
MNLRTISLLRALAAVFIAAALLMMPSACSNDNLIDQVPQPISQFIAQYFPGYGVGQYEHTATGYHIRLKNGPGMNFDASYAWENIDGYGLPIPQVFLFDQTPPKLYSYLQGMSELNQVFSIARNSSTYTLTLLDSSISYDIAHQEITSNTLTN